MDNYPVKIFDFFSQTILHCLCDFVAFSNGQLAIHYDMGFHLVKPPRGSDPQIMHIQHTFHTPGAIADRVKYFWWWGGIGKFTQAIPEDRQTDLYDKERYQKGGERVQYIPGRIDERPCDTQQDSHRGKGVRAVMPCVGYNKLAFNAPPGAYRIMIERFL